MLGIILLILMIVIIFGAVKLTFWLLALLLVLAAVAFAARI